MSIMKGIQINEFGELVISKELQDEIITFLTENDVSLTSRLAGNNCGNNCDCADDELPE